MTSFAHVLLFGAIAMLSPALMLASEEAAPIPCSDEGLCSQKCMNISGSYRCSCMDGYQLINNTCQAFGPEPILVYATLPEIRGIYLRSKRNVLIHKAITKACAVTVHPFESRVYWTDYSSRTSVFSSKIDGSGFRAVLTNGLMDPEGIAVDYLTRNLYITDSGLKQILACKKDGSMCHVLHQTKIEKPRGIALDPIEGYVYWSDWGKDNVGIYRSGMDGSSRIRMVSENIEWPNGIAIDHTASRLYWIDAKLRTIEYITLDGKTRKAISMAKINEVFHPFALTLFEDNLYWSDLLTFSVNTYNKFTGKKTKNELGKYVLGVYVHHPILARYVSNPCLTSSCTHMCLIAPMGNYSCACPSGFNLSDDGRTCAIDDDFPMLLVSDDTSIYRIRSGAVGNDVAEELSLKHSGLIGKLAYDWNTKTLFVSDKHLPEIYAINMTSMLKRKLVEENLMTPEDLAFDSMSGNLYWIDSSKGTVEVISTTTFRTAVIISNLSKPMSIALVPAKGRMFISTIGENPSVSMYDMNGLNGKLIISCSTTSLAVHPSASLLYWADLRAETINSIDFSTSTSTPTILMNKVSGVVSLAVNERNIYWTDSIPNDLIILRHNTSHTHIISLPKQKSELALRKVIYASSPNKAVSGGDIDCNLKNGGCSHLCLSSPGGYSCVCPTDIVLSKDKFTCIDKLCDTANCSQNCRPSPEGPECFCNDGFELQKDNKTCLAAVNIWKGLFACGDGERIPKLWRCDGEHDCRDGKDEFECHSTICDEESQFRCGNGQCISKSWVCDGLTDCIDKDDEENCRKMLDI